jgi:hypothetical protein
LMFFAAAWAMACSSLFFITYLSLPVTGFNDRQLHSFSYSLITGPCPVIFMLQRPSSEIRTSRPRRLAILDSEYVTSVAAVNARKIALPKFSETI